MNHQIINKTLRALVGALFISAIVAQAQAAPEAYVPVTSPKQMKNIKAGTRVAVQCSECGAVSFLTVGQDGKFPRSYTCPHCKLKFVGHSLGGNAGFVGGYEYVDDGGHKAKILRPM
jgi:hypothetical protein